LVNSWKVILATMVIFGTGVVTGSLLVQHAERIRNPHAQHGAGLVRPLQPGSAGGSRFEFLRRAERELNLTPDQRDQIDQLLKASQERTKKLMEPVAPKMREEVQQTKAEFRAVLTPQQRERFDQLVKQQQRPREPRRPLPQRERIPEGAPGTNATVSTNL
jgi:Spy/CpxP family protein refolding chaperone